MPRPQRKAKIEAQAKIARIEKIERKGWAETDGKKDDETPATDTKPRAAAKKRKAEDEDAGAKPKRRKEEPQKGAQAAKAVAPATPRVKPEPAQAAADDKLPPVPSRVRVGMSPEYLVQKRLGKGGFGQVYLGKRATPARGKAAREGKALNEVALKFEHKNSKGCVHGPPYEWQVYKALNTCYGIPKVHNFGQVGDFFVMVMDILGPSLWDVWNEKNNRLSESFVASIAIEAIAILAGLHQKGYVHGDVKPENFLVGPTSEAGKSRKLYLVDLGLAMRWRQYQNKHIEYDQRPDDFRGTIRYASVHAHLGRTASRRDDMESLAYTLMFLLKGSLPWQGYQGEQKGFWVCKKKMQTSAEALCRYASAPFCMFTEAVLALKFDEEPRYAAYINLLAPIAQMSDDLDISGALALVQAQPQQPLHDPEGPRKKTRLGWPAQQWITVYNKQKPMKQRYHYNVASDRLMVHVQKGYDDGLFISTAACCTDLKAPWAVIMDAGTGFHEQVFQLSPREFLPKQWIMARWEEGFYITAVAGMGSPFVADQPPGALVVMSKGTSYAQQSYKISESFPYEWIKRKWREGFFITSMGTSSCQRREPAHDREPNFW